MRVAVRLIGYNVLLEYSGRVWLDRQQVTKLG